MTNIRPRNTTLFACAFIAQSAACTAYEQLRRPEFRSGEPLRMITMPGKYGNLRSSYEYACTSSGCTRIDDIGSFYVIEPRRY